jgi:putative modified peptide
MSQPILTHLTNVAATSNSQTRIHAAVTPAEASTLVTKLATDDAFRKRFAANPRAVLAESHIFVPSEVIPTKVQLPSKKEMQAAIAQIPTGHDATDAVAADWVYIAWVAFIAFAFSPVPNLPNQEMKPRR